MNYDFTVSGFGLKLELVSDFKVSDVLQNIYEQTSDFVRRFSYMNQGVKYITKTEINKFKDERFNYGLAAIVYQIFKENTCDGVNMYIDSETNEFYILFDNIKNQDEAERLSNIACTHLYQTIVARAFFGYFVVNQD